MESYYSGQSLKETRLLELAAGCDLTINHRISYSLKGKVLDANLLKFS